MTTRLAYLGLIPARGGSKGLPGKHVLPLAGRPMLQWTCDAARQSRRLDAVLFSSDDEELIGLARAAGCEAPFVRPAQLASDTTPTIDVVLHALDWLEAARATTVDALVLLQPTCPFRTAADIDAAIDAFEHAGADSLVSIEPITQHPCEAVSMEGGRLRLAIDPPRGSHGRQAFPDYYYINGAIYISKVALLRERRVFQTSESACYLMPRNRGLDINELYDYHLAAGIAELSARGAQVFGD